MNVVYLGNYRHSFCTEVHITRELEALGHQVVRVQERPGGGTIDDVAALEATAHESLAEVVFWQRTWGMPPAETTALWRRLEADGIKTASYHLDLYLGLHRQRDIAGDPFWSTGTVFTPDGNLASEEWFRDHGIRHVWSPPAVVSDELADVMPGTKCDEYDYDVVFVGSPGTHYHGEWPWRGELIAALERRYRKRFRRFGGDMPGGPVRGMDLNDLYATARVVVGDSCFAHPKQWYWSDRPMETYGRGGIMAFPRITLLQKMLGPYPTYEVGDMRSVFEAVDYLLDHQENARAWSQAAVRHIRSEHTYQARMERALMTLGD